jgi:uncharacterized glyoxalase superfamily protein PhnB
MILPLALHPRESEMAKKDKKAKADKKANKVARKEAKKKGRAKVAAIPKGLHSVTANLIFHDSAKAIAFYEQAFGAKEISRAMAPDGKSVWHAEIRIGDAALFMNDASPMTFATPASETHRATCSFQLYVKDCDAVFERAVNAGGKPAMPVQDMFWGDRMGSVLDPFGVMWNISTRIANLTPKQMKKAGEEFAQKMAEQQGAPPSSSPTSAPNS